MPTLYGGSKAQAGRNSQYLIGNITGSGGTENYQLVGEVSETNLAELTWSLEDTTNFQSGNFIERMSTVADPGTVSLKYNYISGQSDAGQVALVAANNNGQPYDHQIFLSANPKLNQVVGDQILFSAFVSKAQGLQIGVKTAITSSAELTITGARTVIAGSSIVLTANPNPAVHTAPTTLTATFSGPQGANVNGTVQFYDGNVAIGSAEAVAAGSATLSYTFAAGTHSVSAVFTPAANTSYSTATSALLSLIVS